MVKLIGPLFSEAASGVLHRVLGFRNTTPTASVAKLPTKILRISDPQKEHRDLWNDTADDWQDLEGIGQAPWKASAPVGLNGYSWYMKNKILGIDYPSGFKYRFKITIDHDEIGGDLTHYPLLIHLSASCGLGSYDASDIFDKLADNKLKIAVTKSDGYTPLYVEIEYWDSATEKAELWISKSDLVLLSASDVDLYLYYDPDHADNTDYVGTAGDRPEVWDDDFAIRWDMCQDPSGDAPQMIDSTEHAAHGTTGGAMTDTDLVAGLYSKAINFDGVNDKAVGTPGSFYDWPCTLQGFIQVQSLAAEIGAMYFSNNVSQSKMMQMGIHTTGKPYCYFVDGTGSHAYGTTIFAVNDWVDLALVCVSDTVKYLYANGVYEATYSTNFPYPDNVAHMDLGCWARPSPYYYLAKVADARISGCVRSVDWIYADYKAKVDALVTIGAGA